MLLPRTQLAGPKLVEPLSNGYPPLHACLIASECKFGRSRGNMIRRIPAIASFDGQCLGPSFLLFRHSKAGPTGADFDLFQGSVVRSITIRSSGKHRS